MNHVNLLAAHNSIHDLKNFSSKFFSMLEISDFEERESSHFIGGHYFFSSINGMTIIISISDETGNDDLPFWIQINEKSENENSAQSYFENTVKINRKTNEFLIYEIVNLGKKNSSKINFQETND